MAKISQLKNYLPQTVKPLGFDQFFEEKLESLHNEGRYRVFAELRRDVGNFPQADFYQQENKKPVTVWCSNDYLSLGQHPKILEKMHEALDHYGSSSGGTRNISGTTHLHVELEKSLAGFHNKERALLLTSGYVANMAVLETLGRTIPDIVFFSDAGNHNSIIEGIRHSRAEKRIFKHNDVTDLERLLAKEPSSRLKLVVFESVYSMSGAIAPIVDIVAVAKKYGALTYIDEVHAVGLYGKHGAGVAQRENVMDDIDIVQGTLAKALGNYGGYIAGKEKLIDFIRSFSYGFIFTSSLPPSVVAGAIEAVKIIQEGSELRKKYHDKVKKTFNALEKAGLPVIKTPSHIIPLRVGDSRLCKKLTDCLLDEHHIYVQPINYPTVPKGQELMRFTPQPVHQDKDIEMLVEALCQLWKKHSLDLTVRNK